MDIVHQNQFRQAFRQYDQAYAAHFDQLLEEQFQAAGSLREEPDLPERVAFLVRNDLQNWFTQNQPGLLEQVTDLEDALTLAVLAAEITSSGIPDEVRLTLARFQPQILTRITEWLAAGVWEEMAGEEERPDQTAASALIELLGEWQIADAAAPLLTAFCAAEVPAERLADALRTYLNAVPEAALPLLHERLEAMISTGADMRGSGEYLIIFLAEIGRRNPANEHYPMLRRSFLAMANKVIGAICLGDLDDGRAVPFLRGWYQRNGADCGIDVRQEVFSAIRRLGGEIEDLKQMFR